MIPLIKTKKQLLREKLRKVNRQISQIYQLMITDDRIELYSKVDTGLINKGNQKIYNKKKLQTLKAGSDEVLESYLDGILLKIALDTSLEIMKKRVKAKGGNNASN